MQDITEKVQQAVFTMLPALKDLYENTNENITIDEALTKTLNYKTDPTIFQEVALFYDILFHKIAALYGENQAFTDIDFIKNHSILETQTHLSLFRSFDNHARRIGENGVPLSNENYNSLILNSFIFEQFYFPLTCNTGGIKFGNETSPAFLQYGPKTTDAINLISCGKHYKASEVSSYKMTNEMLLELKEKIQNIPDTTIQEYLMPFFELYANNDFVNATSLCFNKQLHALFQNKPEIHSIELLDVMNDFILKAIEKNDNLISYIYHNNDVYYDFLNSFSGIQMGWTKETDASGTESFNDIYSFKPSLTSRPTEGLTKKTAIGFKKLKDGTFETDSIDTKITKMKTNQNKPTSIASVIFTLIGTGIASIGGIAQINYNKVVQKRAYHFLNTIAQKIENGIYPPLPKNLTPELLRKRAEVIKNMPMGHTVAIGMITGNKPWELASYSDFLDTGSKIDAMQLKKLGKKSFKMALEYTLLFIYEYKLGNGDFDRLVGDERKFLPQSILTTEEKKEYIKKVQEKYHDRLPSIYEISSACLEKTLIADQNTPPPKALTQN